MVVRLAMPEGSVQETKAAIQIIHPGVYYMEGKEKNQPKSDGMGFSWGETSSFNRRPRRHEKLLELG